MSVELVPTSSQTSPVRAQPISGAARIPALDGVRGLAILLVMFTHFTLLQQGILIDRVVGAAGRFGWSGVDLFFVLSGFLITGILLDNKGHENYFRSFYARRILRIFPLYYLVIFFATIVLPWLPMSAHEHFHAIPPQRIPLFWFYLSNIPVAFTSDWTNDFLGITWSLAIEEQFYLIWPLVVLLCSQRALRRICIGLIVTALLVRIGLALAGVRYMVLYVLTFCRMDGIAVGALIALMMRQMPPDSAAALLPRVRRLAIACAVILLGIVAWHGTTHFDKGPGQTIGYSVIAVLYGCVLLLALHSAPGSIANRLFSHKWLMFFGKYSYALYLLHMPIHRMLRVYVYGRADFLTLWGSQLPGQLIFYAMAFPLSIAAALLSWHLLEKRFLSLKRFFPTQKRATTAAAWEGADVARGGAAAE